MNLQQLEYLKNIAETENFTTAASLSSVTQPALSKAISKLEAELNVTLFERNGRNVKLTSFGEAFLKHANVVLLEIEKGIRELNDMVDSNREVMSIASTHCIGTYFMPFIISDFLRCCPNTKFEFNHESISEILDDLKNGNIDLGFYDKIDYINVHPEIKSVAVKKEEYVLIVSKNHPLSNKTEVSLKDLKDESFIFFNQKTKDTIVSYSEFIGYTPKASREPIEVSMLGGLVAAGAGIAIIPNTVLINTNTTSIIKIKENIGHRTIYMGWLKDSYMSPITSKFRDYVISLVNI